MSLVDATFDWIREHVRDKVDFVVWTGDSARHDSDENIPRTADQILHTNTYIAEKFEEVFGNGGANHNPSDMEIPVVPTFGNNDILPHNILLAGPNRWLNTYTSLWRKFIPEAQRHGFQRGGWFYVEVIPNKLAVFSLNSLYFFTNNAGVDGCAARSEPGYEHMEWLRVQLQLMRERSMKVILQSHVGPARTPSKQLWDETCWQKYTLWMQQYRDVVVGGLYGHMNIDHFMLQDAEQVNLLSFHGLGGQTREYLGDELTIQSAGDYLEELRTYWSSLPDPAEAFKPEKKPPRSRIAGKRKKGKKPKETKREKALKKIGGEWAERFQLSLVGPSVVPNYFPTIRIMEYNISGLDTANTWASQHASSASVGWNSDLKEHDILDIYKREARNEAEAVDENLSTWSENEGDFDWERDMQIEMKKKHKKHKKKQPKKDPDLHIPLPPTPGTPPGPAYSPQPFTLNGYTQYYANLTEINDDMTNAYTSGVEPEVGSEGWHEGRNKGKLPKNPGARHPVEFHFEEEYNTFNDTTGFNLKDLTVRSYLKLAHRIGRYKAPVKGDWVVMSDGFDDEDVEDDGDDLSVLEQLRDLAQGYVDHLADIVEDFKDVYGSEYEMTSEDDDSDEPEVGENTVVIEPKKKRRKHRNGHDKKNNRHGKNRNKAWRTFLKRAFVGILDEDDLEKFDVEINLRAAGVDAEVVQVKLAEGVEVEEL